MYFSEYLCSLFYLKFHRCSQTSYSPRKRTTNPQHPSLHIDILYLLILPHFVAMFRIHLSEQMLWGIQKDFINSAIFQKSNGKCGCCTDYVLPFEFLNIWTTFSISFSETTGDFTFLLFCLHFTSSFSTWSLTALPLSTTYMLVSMLTNTCCHLEYVWN